MSSNALPPLQALTPTDHGAIVVVVAYCFAGFTVVGAGARIAITIVQKQGFHRDDIGFFGGALLAVIMSILSERAVDVGLGRHIDTLNESILQQYYRLVYVASLFGLFAMLGAKVSIVLLYKRIAPQQASLGMYFLYGCIEFWAVFAIIVQAFQCGASVAFVPDQCVSGNMQYPSIILNIITDAMLSFWMAPRIWALQSSTEARVVPIVLFGLRIVVCFVSIGQLVVYAQNISKVDQTWARVVPWALNIIVVHVSTFHATLPRINSFILDVSSGQIDLRVADRDIELMENSKSGNSNSRSGNKSNNHSVNPKSAGPSTGEPQDSRRRSAARNTWSAQRTSSDELQTSCYRKKESDLIDRDHGGDVDETSSQTSLSRNAVYQTVEFSWREDYERNNTPGAAM